MTRCDGQGRWVVIVYRNTYRTNLMLLNIFAQERLGVSYLISAVHAVDFLLSWLLSRPFSSFLTIDFSSIDLSLRHNTSLFEPLQNRITRKNGLR